VKAGASRCSAVMLMLDHVKAEYELAIHTPEQTKEAAFLKLNPLGHVPVLETAQGPIYHSNVIARWIGRSHKALLGKNEKEALEVEQWLDSIRNDLMNARSLFLYQIYGFKDSHLPKISQEEFAANLDKFIAILHVFDQHLAGKDFLVGNELSAADISLICDLEPVYRFVFAAEQRAKLPALTAYFEKHIKEPLFKSLYGNTCFPAAPIAVDFCKKGHHDKKHDDKHEKKHDEKKKDEKKKDEKKDDKKEEKKKEEKPKKKDDEEEEEHVEPKKEYVFPETNFKFFDFKTLYVNEPDKKKALQFLWDNWDAKAFSFWYLAYDKLPTECKKIYLTNNLMNGFLDRAELCRKHALGVHGVYGEEPDLDIRGVWLWKGTEMLEPLKEHQQFDVYKYTKLDPANPKDKALIEEYWTHLDEGKVEGRTICTIKLFK